MRIDPIMRLRCISILIMMLFCFTSYEVNPQAQQTGEIKLAPVLRKAASFNHNRREHMRACSTCHVRSDNRAKQNLPYHNACIDCHVSDFTSTASQLCTDCHQMPLGAKAQTVAFGGNLKEFGVHNFSHRDHSDPAKMKKTVTCNQCHSFDAPRVRATFPGHPQCFSCHNHQPGQKQGTCETCHTFRSTATVYTKGLSEAYSQYKFTHASHFIQKSIGNNCAKCHPLLPVALARQSDITQIKTPREFNGHTSDCWRCHKSREEFTCGKCHVGGPPLGKI